MDPRGPRRSFRPPSRVWASAAARIRPSPAAAEDENPILAGLNTAQSIAVKAPASVVQILAPPGSGKTRTLTSRVAYLLSDAYGFDPQDVIVATFTVKAANEMKGRLAALVGNGIEKKLLLGTFHSIALRYLKRYGHLIGLKPGWTIADTADSSSICSRILLRMKLPVGDAGSVRSRISHFKARNMTPVACAAAKPPPSTIQASQKTQSKASNISTDQFVKLYWDYQAALEQQNLLDYDDLLLRCLELLRAHPECVSNIEAVLVDEFQDTNAVQFDLMRKFATARERITIVGDPDQSIYGWRAAEIGNLKLMRTAYLDTHVINLEENYRSSASILQVALEVIQQDQSRPDKPLTPTHVVGTSPVLRRVLTASAEAQWITGEIKRIRAVTGGMIGLNDIAILVRSANLTRNIETALVRGGIAYKMVGGFKFFDRKEVKHILDYMRVLQNPSNNDALARIVNVPTRGVSDGTCSKLLEEAEKKGISVWSIICKSTHDGKWPITISKQAEKGLGQFKGIIESLKKMIDGDGNIYMSLLDIMEGVLKKTGYDRWLKDRFPEDIETRWANVQELFSQARDFNPAEADDALPEVSGIEQQVQEMTVVRTALERFLANAALVSEKSTDAEPDKDGQVTISTIHAAKGYTYSQLHVVDSLKTLGLEWPTVFIPALYDGCIPHSRAEDSDEERRLLYVAMTRAKALLFMSCPLATSSKEKTTLSPFLDDKKVLRLLSSKAPNMPFSVIQSLGHILRLPCPTELELRTSIEKSGIPSERDDIIPEKEVSEHGGGEDDKNAAPEYQHEQKRRRLLAQQGTVESQLAGVPRPSFRTFTTAEAFAHARPLTTAEQLNFRSAATHYSDLQQHSAGGGVVTCEAERAAREERLRLHELPAKIGAATGKSVSKSSSSKQQPKQQIITGFFKKKEAPPPPPQKPLTASDVVQSFQHTPDMPLSEQLASLPPPILPKRHSGDFILLSSSPPRPAPAKRKLENVGEAAPPSSTAFEAYKELLEDKDMLLPRPPLAIAEEKENTKKPLVAVTAGISAGSGRGRKTLGVRRSMNGWANRGRGR